MSTDLRASATAGMPGTLANSRQKRSARPRMIIAHRWIARVLLVALVVQIFFAGLGIFGVASFDLHATLGPLIILSSLALPIVAWIGRLERPALSVSWALVGLLFLQLALVIVAGVAPVISALHPVNAMILVLVTFYLSHFKR